MIAVQPDWTEHAVSILVISGCLIAALVTLAASLARQVFKQLLVAINQLTEAISKLFGKFEDHEHRLSMLEGSHKERTTAKQNCVIK